MLKPVAHLSFVHMKYPVYVRMYINDMLKPVPHLCAIQCMHYTECFSLGKQQVNKNGQWSPNVNYCDYCHCF